MTHFSATPGTPFPIEVRTVASPDGLRRVLLQLPDGFVLLNAEDADVLAVMLQEASEELLREPTP
jgi:hypothetical protein